MYVLQNSYIKFFISLELYLSLAMSKKISLVHHDLVS